MRTLQSKNKFRVPVPHPPFISLCIVTHYQTDPYHAQRMEVVKTSLRTMLAGMTGASYELLIWDNDSTPEFRAMLKTFKPTVMIESINIGAHNARRNLALLARGEIMMQADDDILYHPDWLSLQLEILSVYPNVGIVSGSPYRWAFTWGQTQILPPEIKRIDGAIPDQWIKDACASVGQDYIASMWELKNVKDVLLEYQGVKAWNHGHHMQFIGRREVLTQFLKPNKYLLGNGREFNEDILKAGLLQLTTYHRTAIHIGNVLDPRLREIMKDWKVE